jgi:hypothetical protein
MKKNILALLLLSLTINSCKKIEAGKEINILEDKGCIERANISVNDHSGHKINNTTISIIDNLFQTNGIDKTKFRFFFYDTDSVQTYFAPFTKYGQKIIRINQFTNGLEIFTSGTVYSFWNDNFKFRNGELTSGTTLNTTPTLSIGQVRTLFLGHIEQFDQKGNQFKDSCFSAQFGYFDLNAGTSNSAENLIKAWKVTLKNRIYPSEIPIAFYKDDNGNLIYYDNGIRTFR